MSQGSALEGNILHVCAFPCSPASAVSALVVNVLARMGYMLLQGGNVPAHLYTGSNDIPCGVGTDSQQQQGPIHFQEEVLHFRLASSLLEEGG
jgi:hypothetical protein